jgi:hypothetical protein
MATAANVKMIQEEITAKSVSSNEMSDSIEKHSFNILVTLNGP